MRGDGQDGHLALLGSVAPEDAVRARSVVLGVSLEDLPLRIEGILERVVLVGVEAAVAGVGGELSDGLGHLLEQPLLLGGLRLLLPLDCLFAFARVWAACSAAL